MAALAEPLLMTVEQFQALPERGDALQELQWGHLVTVSRPTFLHVRLQAKLARLLRSIADERGEVFTEFPFQSAAQYELRAADVAFVSQSRLDQTQGSNFRGAPELVIEVLSPSNTKAQLREYAALCLANGCIDFWLVDHVSKTITVTGQSGKSIQYSSGMSVPLAWLGEKSIAVDLIFG